MRYTRTKYFSEYFILLIAGAAVVFRRLDKLSRGLAKEISIVDKADDPMLRVERQAYLAGMHQVVAGIEKARVTFLAKARQRIDGESSANEKKPKN